jgi:hypothetical protein
VSVVNNLLLVLVSAVILRSETRGTHDHIYCLRFETSPTWRTRPSCLYPAGTWWPSYTPRHWVPFSSPPMTHRATVEVFDPAFTRECNPSCFRSSLYSLGTAPTENTGSFLVACWFTPAEICLRHCCIVTLAERNAENTALLLLLAFASAGMCLPHRYVPTSAVLATENTALLLLSVFASAGMCLPHRCIATSAVLTTENTALLLLLTFASAEMCLPNRCLRMNYSGFRASCHNNLLMIEKHCSKPHAHLSDFYRSRFKF